MRGGRSKGKRDSYTAKAKGWSWGKGIWQVDGKENQGDHEWNQQEEEKPGRIEAVTKVTDKDGLECVKRPRRLGQHMPAGFAVDAEKVGDSNEELSKKRFCRDERSRGMCNRWSCK